MSKEIKCSVCGATLTEETSHTFDGHTMCEHCFTEKTTVCECCGERIWCSDAEGDSCVTLCHSCYEYNYSTCEDCGRLIHNDDAQYEDDSDYPYCIECFERLQSRVINSYYYKPTPIFYGEGSLFYGIELEIDKGGEFEEKAQILLNIANNHNEHMYCKHDGSLSDGLELTTHPHTYKQMLKDISWQELFDKAIELGYRSHNSTTCGYHIHVSRNAFGGTREEQEETIARIVHFVELHWNELLKFSRRTEASINRWACRYGISTKVCDTYKNAKDKHLGRYSAVNLEPYDTIEFRLFRGTLKLSTFIATLQLVDEICTLAILLSDKDFENMSWSEFVTRIPGEKTELINYLKSKRLYVNEPQTEQEEI